MRSGRRMKAGFTSSTPSIYTCEGAEERWVTSWTAGDLGSILGRAKSSLSHNIHKAPGCTRPLAQHVTMVY
jgi:hypothetical protein